MDQGPNVLNAEIGHFQSGKPEKNRDPATDSGYSTSTLSIEEKEEIPVHYDVDRQLGDSLESLPLPPDGGYGWVVCFASFMILLVLDGMMFTFGVFFVELLDSFQESKGKTAMVGSALLGGHLIAGPFTSAMVNLWGVRRVAVVGSVIACIAFAGSTAAPSLNILIFTYGILGGIGVSMVYLPAVLIVGFYFHRRRAIANGIGNSGAGIGTFVFAPLSQMLLDEYSWRGALLILAGLVLNCAVMSSLFRPLEKKRPLRKRHGSSVSNTSSTDVDSHCLLHKKVKHLKEWEMNVAKLSQSHGDIPNSTQLSPTFYRLSMSFQQLPNKLTTVDRLKLQDKVTSQPILEAAPPVNFGDSIPSHLVWSGAVMNKPMYRKDAFYSGSVWRLAEAAGSSSPQNLHASMLRLDEQDFCNNTSEDTQRRSYFLDSLRQMVDVRLLKDPVFVLCIGSGVLWTTQSSVLSILPDYATLCGSSKTQASLLLSLLGVANVIGRLVAGFLADQPRVDCLWINTASLFLGGLVNLLMPFTTSFPLLAAEAFVFGLSMATWVSLRPIILVELLGIDRLTNAFGLMVMFQGIAFCVGPPVAGTLYDQTGSYTIPFLLAGLAFILSALLSLSKRWVLRCAAKNSNPQGNPKIQICVEDFSDVIPECDVISECENDDCSMFEGKFSDDECVLDRTQHCLEKAGIHFQDI